MPVESGRYPYGMAFPFPFRVPLQPSGGVGNPSGVLSVQRPTDGARLVSIPLLSGVHLGNQWFLLFDQYRRFKRFDSPLAATAHINIGITRTINEPDPSGFAFTAEFNTPEFNFAQAGNRLQPSAAVSGAAQITTSNYITDLRSAHESLFTAMEAEYDSPSTDFSVDINGIEIPWDNIFFRRDFLKSFFRDTPSGVIGDYNYDPSNFIEGSMQDITWAEVLSYHPYPRIASREIINGTNNIHDTRGLSSSALKTVSRQFGRIDFHGPVFPACITTDGKTISTSGTSREAERINNDGDFTISLSGWTFGPGDAIRVDGHILVSGQVELLVLDNVDAPTAGNAVFDNEQYIVYGRSNVIAQSGARELGRTLTRRTPNVGRDFVKHAATVVGFPSHSGEPLRLITGGQPLNGAKIIDADHSTRAWYKVPVLGAVSGDAPFTLGTPRFGDVTNVKRLAVRATDAVAAQPDSSGRFRNGMPTSGILSVWPSPGAYAGGSGQGLHIMDKGLWVRNHHQSLGMTLYSPYNLKRLGFKFADVNPRFIEQNVSRVYQNAITFDNAAKTSALNPQLDDFTYGVSWGNDVLGTATLATSFGCHRDGFYHIFGSRQTPAGGGRIAIDDANVVGVRTIDNGFVNLVSDFTTLVADAYPAGFSSITHYNEAKSHAVWGIPSLDFIGSSKVHLDGDHNIISFGAEHPRPQNGTIAFILLGFGPFFGRIPCGYSVPRYFTIASWSPGLALTEDTSDSTLRGRGNAGASTHGYLATGGFPLLTRPDLWRKATTPDGAGFQFGIGTAITPGTHPAAIAPLFIGTLDPAITYSSAETQIFTISNAGDKNPTITAQDIAAPTTGSKLLNDFTFGIVAGSIGSQQVAAIVSDLDMKHFGNRGAGGTERQVTDFTVVDEEVIGCARGNNRNSDFANKLSIAKFDVDSLGADFLEGKLHTQDVDPGADFDYIGESMVTDPDDDYWPQITFANTAN